MNLIDFRVIEIISEEKDKLNKLLGVDEEELKDLEYEDPWWYEQLCSDAIKQKYKYVDDGGEHIGEECFIVGKMEPYYKGYVGQH